MLRGGRLHRLREVGGALEVHEAGDVLPRGLECAIGTGNVGRYDEAIALAAKGELGLPPEQAVLAPALKQIADM